MKNFDKTEKPVVGSPVLWMEWLIIRAGRIKIFYLTKIWCFSKPRRGSEFHWHLPNACGGFALVTAAQWGADPITVNSSAKERNYSFIYVTHIWQIKLRLLEWVLRMTCRSGLNQNCVSRSMTGTKANLNFSKDVESRQSCYLPKRGLTYVRVQKSI